MDILNYNGVPMYDDNFGLNDLASLENICKWNALDSAFNVTCKWTIQNFHFGFDVTTLDSPEFCAGEGNFLKWRFQMQSSWCKDTGQWKMSTCVKFKEPDKIMSYFWRAHLLKSDTEQQFFANYDEENTVRIRFASFKDVLQLNDSVSLVMHLVVYMNPDESAMTEQAAMNMDMFQFSVKDLTSLRDISVYNRINATYVACKWVVQRFPLEQTKFESSEFRAGEKRGLTWKLQLENEGNQIMLQIKFLNERPVTYLWRAYILNRKNVQQEIFSEYLPGDVLQIRLGSTFDYLMLNSSITIICYIIAVKKELCTSLYAPQDCSRDKEDQVQQLFLQRELRDYGKLLNDDTLADTILKVQGQHLPAHKVILAARSPVFFSMFSGNRALDIIEISDVDCNSMKLLMKFMYTAEIDNLNYETATKLLPAAAKYSIEGLKQKSEIVLSESLDLENVFNTLSLADAFKLDKLKEYAFTYVVDNLKNFEKRHFVELCKIDQKLLVEILCRTSTMLANFQVNV